MSSEDDLEQSSQLIIAKPIIRATVILGVREKSGTADEHTAYKIVCEKPGSSRYVVLKRFRDFFQLRTAIAKSIGQLPFSSQTIVGYALYAFPKRRYFNNLSDEVVSERVLGLNAFLSLLIEDLPSARVVDSLVAEFLKPQMDTETLMAMRRTSAEIVDADEPRRRSGSTTSVPDFEVRVKMLPLWIYLFNPWTETADQLEGGKRLPFGRLYVHVIGASGLMASDYAMFSKPSSDPYCQIEVGAVEKEVKRTHKINATLNPNWDEEFVMNVWRPRAVLTLKVYDYDTASRDDHIGEVHVPIEMLRNQELHDLWFDLHPEPSDIREKTKKPALGRIRVRLQYKFSHLGEYLAHFLEKETPIPEAFNVNSCYNHGQRTAALLKPIVDLGRHAAAVITWEYPFVTCLIFAVYAFVCLNSRFLLPICHLPIIAFIVKKGCYRYLILQYTKYGTKGVYGRRYMGKLPSAEEIGLMKEFIWDITSDADSESDRDAGVVEEPAPLKPPSRKKSKNSVQDTGPKGKTPADPEKDGLGATGTALNTLFAVIPGLKSTLQDVQNGIVHANDELEDIYSVFDWSNPTVTRDVLLILIITSITTSFVDLNYVLLAGGAIGLFCTSQVGQKVILFFKGIGRYTKTLRYKKFETSGNVHADVEIQKKIYKEMRRRTRTLTLERTLRDRNIGNTTTTSVPPR